MGYVAPTWQNGGPPALNAKNMQDISDNLAYVSNHMVNPNLLDNWYFGNPVNQRGQTSYTGVGYTIDRFVSGGGLLELSSGNIACTATAGGQVYRQPISPDLRRALAGEKVTFSTLCSEISGNWMLTDTSGFADVHADVKIDSKLKSWTFTVSPGEETGTLGWWAEKAGERIAIRAVKLEPGSQQTLAHKEYGEWVLNEIPKFGDQLAECQRYYYRWPYLVQYFQSVVGGWSMADIQFPVTMRTTPVISGIAGDNVDDLTINVSPGGVHLQKQTTQAVSITNFEASADL